MSEINKNESLNYINNCTFVKTVLMLIVVLYHSILFWKGGWFTVIYPERTFSFISVISSWLASFHIYGFVLTSGYIYSFLRFEHNKYQRLCELLGKKIKRLIVPYFFIAIFWAIPFDLFLYRDSLFDAFKNYFLALSPRQLWFLPMLFIVFLCVGFVSDFVYNHTFYSIVFSFGMYFIGISLPRFIDNYFQIASGFQFILFFMIGLKLRQFHRNGLFIVCKFRTIMLMTSIDLLILFLYIFVSEKNNYVYKLLSIVLLLILRVLGSIFIFYFLQVIASRINWKTSKTITLLSNSSMSIYLLHQQIVCLLLYLLYKYINPFILMSMCFSISIFVSVLISSVFRKSKIAFLLGG